MTSAHTEKGEPMSIILKGIDMPKCSNEDCIVVIRKDKAEVWQTGFKERTVEAIQIPKDHGRLIDADALELEKEVELADDWKTAHEIANCVKYAPTILEAEE